MPGTLDADTARRLALVRLLLARAGDMVDDAAPFSFDSVNRLHDCAEMFLALAVGVHHVSIPKDFGGYWSTLASVLGRPLGYQAQMQRFNKIRVNLKHYGVEPAAREVSEARVTVTSLIRDECEPLFGVTLDDVSLVDFIRSPAAKSLVEQAEKLAAQGAYEDAMLELADGFDVLIRDYEGRKMLGFGRSVFDSTSDMTMQSPFFRRVEGKQKAFEENVIASLGSLDFTIMIVGLGIDFRRYGKFRAHTPTITRTVRGGRFANRPRGATAATPADFEFCRDFVVTSAIRLADFDYDVDFEAEWRRAAGGTSSEETP